MSTQLPRSVNRIQSPEAPHARVHVEVRGAVAHVAGVVPEADRHRRHRLADHELAQLAHHLAAVGVECGRVDARGSDRRSRRGRPAAAGCPARRRSRRRCRRCRCSGARPARAARTPSRTPLRAAASRPWPAAGATRGRTSRRPAARPCGTPSAAPGRRPCSVGRVSSASRHCSAMSGYSGLPSSITIEARNSSVETSAFHIIQAVVVNHISRSPGWRSQLRPWFLKCSTRMPPWPCTIGFGQPRRAGREEDVQRVVERHRVERERAALGEQLVPAERVGQRVVAAADVRDVNDVLERRQRRAHGGDLGGGGRRACRRSGSRRRPAAPSARRSRSGRSRCAGRTPVAHVAQTAPRLAVARNATSVSGTFGR